MLIVKPNLSFVTQNFISIVEIAKAISVDPNELEKMPVPVMEKQGLTEEDSSFLSLGNRRYCKLVYTSRSPRPTLFFQPSL